MYFGFVFESVHNIAGVLGEARKTQRWGQRWLGDEVIRKMSEAENETGPQYAKCMCRPIARNSLTAEPKKDNNFSVKYYFLREISPP